MATSDPLLKVGASVKKVYIKPKDAPEQDWQELSGPVIKDSFTKGRTCHECKSFRDGKCHALWKAFIVDEPDFAAEDCSFYNDGKHKPKRCKKGYGTKEAKFADRCFWYWNGVCAMPSGSVCYHKIKK